MEIKKLLPKCKFDFATKDYWNLFYKNKKEDFEWYGNYHQLSKLLHKYIHCQDKLLVIGSGNSNLSFWLYKSGIKDNTNIDISDVAIEKMKEKYNQQLKGLKFIKMDVLNLKFESDSFNVVLDKGTLDSLCQDESSSAIKMVHQMFDQIERVLKLNGRYVCISLLQDHVLKLLLNWFNHVSSYNWLIRIHRCLEAEETYRNAISEDSIVFPVFMIICNKLKKFCDSKISIFEISLGEDFHKFRRLESSEQVINEIESLQKYSIAEHILKNGTSIEEEIFLQIYSQFDALNPRYLIYITDQLNFDSVTYKFASFIVPKGRENEWLFGTSEGRKELAKLSKSARLAVVHCGRYNHYQSKDLIQTELNSMLVSLAPKNCLRDLLKKKVPYLSIGKSIGKRTVLFQGTSDYNGDFVVEDITIENEIFRRLIFLNNQNIVQSEVKLKTIQLNDEQKFIVDSSYLCCKHHAVMLIGFGFYNYLTEKKNDHKILILGLGGGAFPIFLKSNLKLTGSSQMDIVDIDPEMKKVALNCFFLKNRKKSKSNFNLNVIIEDGIFFINSKSKIDQNLYNIIIFDVNSNDSQSGLSCPSPQFIEPDFLQNLKQVMNDSSLLMINLVTRSESVKENFEKKFNKIYPVVYCMKVPKDVNIIYFAFKSEQFVSSLKDKLTSLQSKDVIFEMTSSIFKSRDVFNKLIDIDYIKDNLIKLSK